MIDCVNCNQTFGSSFSNWTNHAYNERNMRDVSESFTQVLTRWPQVLLKREGDSKTEYDCGLWICSDMWAESTQQN